LLIKGFDASAHLSEETHRASWNAPIGVLTSIGVSAAFGWFLMLCLLFSIQNFNATIDPTQNYGEPVFKILVDVFGDDGALVLISLIILCVWHCGLFSLTSNSRMMFAFSRDGALPKFFNHVDKRFQSPTRTVWLAAFLAFCLSLPSLGSSVAFSAATSIATIGLYISYALPILIAVIWPQNFVKGPFDLGKFSWIIGVIACLWVRSSFFSFSSLLACFGRGQ
jgi:amino acid transporter